MLARCQSVAVFGIEAYVDFKRQRDNPRDTVGEV